MNRAQLDALLAAGLLTQSAYVTALATLTPAGQITATPPLDVHMMAPSVRLEVETDDEGKTTGGVLHADTITRYEELIESHGMIIHTGSLVARQPLSKVKMLRDHNHAEPVGYMLSIDDAMQAADFQIAGTEIERVQQEFEDKLRDGLSVGFTIHEYDIDDDWVLHVHRADFYEVSLCAIPAAHEAGVSSVAAALATSRKENHTMNRAQLAAALTAGTITQEQHDAALAALDATETSAAGQRPTGPVPPAVAAGPELQEAQTTPPVAGTQRLNLREMQRHLADAFNSGNHNSIQLALADIVPADDAGQAWLRDDWQGELWRAEEETRTWIDAIGVPEQLTALKSKGWKWGEPDVNGDGGEPTVDEYAGNKTEVPSNEIGTTGADFTAFRIAAGWDVDRAFEDFADAEFQSSFWAAVMRDYKRKSNAGIRTRLLAAATAPGLVSGAAGGVATVATGGVVALLKQLVRDIRAKQGRANRIFLGDEMFAELEDLNTETLPLWLKSAVIGLDIAEGSADVGSLRILNDSTLGVDEGTAFDNRAMKVKEKSPLQVRALNVANGGIDLGFYGYLRLDTHDPRVVVKRTYAEAQPA